MQLCMYMYEDTVCIYLFMRTQEGGGGVPGRPTISDFDNCKQLDPTLSLVWTVNRTSESIRFMLCGCTASDTAQ